MTIVAPILPGELLGQSFRVRLDSRYQSVSFQGLELDSVPIAEVVERPGSGPTTPDGFAANCTGSGYCYFFRPGSRIRGQPLTTTADLTVWGVGLAGLSFRASGRLATDLASTGAWPSTAPTAILTEGYAEYSSPTVTGRLGRQATSGRLGWQGFDGALASYRLTRFGLALSGYGGWGLARAVALPVTSPALNPLDDFQPRDRQLVLGADLALQHGPLDARAEYRREVDPAVDYFVSERVALSSSISPLDRVRIGAGAEYDIASGWWGSAEASASYLGRRLSVTAEAKRYRPFFDLWTIWGAFSPVPYRSLRASAAVEPVAGLWVRGSGERYWFDEDAAESPLVSTGDRGWRGQLSLVATLDSKWTTDGVLRAEFGPGAASRTAEVGVSFQPSTEWSVTARLGTLDRPLELRFSDAQVDWLAATATARLSPRLWLASDLGWFGERRQRPDAAQLDLDQVRVSTRVLVTLGSDADRLPKGRPRPAATMFGQQPR
jgi:hypothetical protein